MDLFLLVPTIILVTVISIPVTIFCVECWTAIWHRSKINLSPLPVSTSVKVAVLIPAHNESSEISKTVRGLQPQLNPRDQIVVIADNCTDNTAILARDCGAIVYERQNLSRKGKGYALDFGLSKLRDTPPDVVVVIDADCRMRAGDIHRIATLAIERNAPIQSLYLMDPPENPTPKDSVSALAYLVRNLVRAHGLTMWRQPCLLTGTGMAFPWGIISKASLATDNIVEDMQFGIDLAVAGHAPRFCVESHVIGTFPNQLDAAKTQRTRWEHGHIQTIFTQVPRLLIASIKQKRIKLAGLALDLCVPPLSLLIFLWLSTWIITIVLGLFIGSWLPAAILSIEGILMVITIYLSWRAFCRDRISKETLYSIPSYFLWKLPVYAAFLFRRQKEWVRTDRDSNNFKAGNNGEDT